MPRHAFPSGSPACCRWTRSAPSVTAVPRPSAPRCSHECPRPLVTGPATSTRRTARARRRPRRCVRRSRCSGRHTSPIPASAPPMPHVEFSQPANQGLWADLVARLPELEASLPAIRVPVGVLVGELSPMPPSAGTDSATRIPGAWSRVEPGAGHFVWHESPGCLLAAMDRLIPIRRCPSILPSGWVGLCSRSGRRTRVGLPSRRRLDLR